MYYTIITGLNDRAAPQSQPVLENAKLRTTKKTPQPNPELERLP